MEDESASVWAWTAAGMTSSASKRPDRGVIVLSSVWLAGSGALRLARAACFARARGERDHGIGPRHRVRLAMMLSRSTLWVVLSAFTSACRGDAGTADADRAGGEQRARSAAVADAAVR